MANFLKKMFDFNIDEKQEEKLEVKEKKATKVDTISTEKVKKASSKSRTPLREMRLKFLRFEEMKLSQVQLGSFSSLFP